MKTTFQGVVSESQGPVKCPCGQEHSGPGWETALGLVDKLGELIDVTVAGDERTNTWRVPRVFIALHGLKAQELPALADKYGWEKIR